MKLRYIIPMFIAAVTMFVGCSEDDEKSALSEIQVSQSVISIPAGDESDADDKVFEVKITLNAAGDWQFKNDENDKIPAWLTITPTKGEAGQHTMVFQATKTTESRSALLKVLCNGQEQQLYVQQIAKKVDIPLSTCEEVAKNGVDGKTYRVKGAVKSIASTTYGNWYLKDETGEVYIYGTLDKNGNEKNFLSLGIGVGDIVTVEGPRKNYNGTIELVNVTVIAIEKSLIAVDAIDIENNTIAKTGGEFHVTLSNKGDGLDVKIPEEAKDWLFVTGINISGETSTVTFKVLPNTGGARKATVTFVTTSGGKEYTAETSITQEADVLPHGENPDDPFTVAEAIAYVDAGGTDAVYVKGVVSELVKGGFGASYGNGSFFISDNGTKYGDPLKDFEAYQVKYLGNRLWTEADPQIAVGDVVIIYGPLTTYNTTRETKGKGAAYIYSLNGKTE